MKIKYVIFLSLICSLVLVLSACSGGTAVKTEAPPAAPAVESAPAVEAPSPTEAPPVEVPAVAEAPAQPEPEQAQALDGQKLVETRCTACHSLDRVTSAKKSADDWASNVKRMVAKGAELSDAEQQAVIQYLSETYK